MDEGFRNEDLTKNTAAVEVVADAGAENLSECKHADTSTLYACGGRRRRKYAHTEGMAQPQEGRTPHVDEKRMAEVEK